MEKNKTIVQFSNRIERLENKLQEAVLEAQMQEKRRALLRGLTSAFEIQAEILRSSGKDFDRCVAKLIKAEYAEEKTTSQYALMKATVENKTKKGN